MADTQWRTVALSEVCSLRADTVAPQDALELPYVGLEHIDSGQPNLRRRGNASEVRSTKNRFRCGDVLYGKLRPYLDKAVLADNDGICSTDILVLSPSEQLEAGFLVNLLHSQPLIEHAVKTTHGVNHPRTSWSGLGQFEFSLPPLPQQQAITRVLQTVQKAKETRQRKLALERERKAALMEFLFTCGIRGESRKHTEVGDIPVSWRVVNLEDAVTKIDYGISAPIPVSTPPGAVKIVSTADITKDGRVLYDKIRRIEAPERAVARLTLRTGDVLFNWRNSPELIGKTAVFEEQDEPHVFASFILRIECDERMSHNFYLAQLLNYFRERGVFVTLSRRAVNQANYNRNEISALKIPLPECNEQREISRLILSCDNAIAFTSKEVLILDELFQAMLQRLISGRVDIRPLIEKWTIN